MSVLFIFIFISILVVSALLFFNKGEKSLEIKSILKDILENLKDLFSNLKKLFLIIKELIQSKLDQEPIQLEDGNKTAETPNSTSPNESKSELEIPSEDSNSDSTNSQTEVTAETDGIQADVLETTSEDSSINETSNDIKID